MSDWIKASKKSENDTTSQPATTSEEKNDFFYEVALTGLTLVAAYYSAKLFSRLVFGQSSIGSSYDETSGYYYENTGKRKSTRLHAKLQKLRLNSYERMLIQDVVDPEEISTSFSHVGGLTDVKKKLREMIIYPMKHPEIFIQKSSLYSPPRGVLLYGRPGCGKTMLAKCLAKESGAFFINVRVSSICDKWFGESEKKVRALFSLARKLSPCIIFVDEIEVFLKTRESMSNEPVMDKVKSEFLIEWDGLVTDCKATGKTDIKSNKKNINNNEKSDVRRSIVPFNVLLLGATNRPGDVDEAFVRRMPRSFKVLPPNENARRIILYNILSRELEHDAIKNLNFQEIGKLYQPIFSLENRCNLTSI